MLIFKFWLIKSTGSTSVCVIVIFLFLSLSLPFSYTQILIAGKSSHLSMSLGSPTVVEVK